MLEVRYLFGYQEFLDFMKRDEMCKWCPLQESNLQLALRRGSLYPFN